MFIQFDAITNNTEGLKSELIGQGFSVISISASRWVDDNQNDRGPRLDVEVSYIDRQGVEQLEQAVLASTFVIPAQIGGIPTSET